MSLKPLVAIGLVSYSAYLWHQPLLAFIRIGFAEPPGAEVMLAAVAATFLLAGFTWRFVETPFRRTMPRRAVLSSTALTAAVLSMVGAAAIFTRGFHDTYVTHRLSPEQAAVFQLVQRQVDIAMDRTMVDDGACRFFRARRR